MNLLRKRIIDDKFISTRRILMKFKWLQYNEDFGNKKFFIEDVKQSEPLVYRAEEWSELDFMWNF